MSHHRICIRGWQGKQQNLRMQSISTIMSLLGLVIKEKGISLVTNRVHFWFVDEKLFAPKKAYAHLSSVSRLLANTAITKVAVPGDKQDYVLLGGNYGVRVVVVINKTILNKNKNFVTPDLVKGAFGLTMMMSIASMLLITRWLVFYLSMT